jgi:chromosome segregation ATPase
MYEDVKEIIPIDNEIDNVLFFNNYVEKGIVIKPKVSSLKQFWTEYRLINNEKKEKPTLKKQQHEDDFDKNTIKKIDKDLDNFDKLFEALSQRVEEINKYIDELKEMRTNIDKTSKKLEADKEQLASERTEFNSYKQKEENKLNKEKETLKINFARLQTIIDDLDNKLTGIDEKKNN